MTVNTDTAKTYTAHYISGTHWDREWYRPFQEFRILLVELVDLLLDLMERQPTFKYFHFDGQTCMLEDYLAVRPENRPRLAKLIKDGRILIGPWFTMPDLFGPGAEALLRNLLVGRRIAQQWGVEPMNVAYTCDMFGHPSQMPQIYAGFGLDYCVLGRGTNEHTTPAFFRWQAPDGSEVFTFKLQDAQGYGAFTQTRQALKDLNDDPRQQDEAARHLRRYVEHETQRSNGSVICLIDAVDHILPAADAPRYLELLHQACPHVRGSHSTLPAFFAEARHTTPDPPARRGELREPAKGEGGYLHLIPDCPSARVRMKQANDRAQAMLEQWAEPWAAFANLAGADIPEKLLDIAWRYILQCHAHDSICGCSVDQVHRDMMYRYDQARIIGAQVRHRALAALTSGCADLAADSDDAHAFTLTIANPTPWRRREVVAFDVDLPLDWPTSFCDGFNGQRIKAFVLTDMDGREVPYQRLGMQPELNWRSAVTRPAFIGDGPRERYTVAAELDLPALGFTSLLVQPTRQRVRRLGSLRTTAQTAENEHLAVSFAGNGALTITDKTTGETYRDLLTFEDRAETGDGWFHVGAINDETVISGAGTQVSVVHDGPEAVTFRQAVRLDVPRRFDAHAQQRSADRAVLEIVSLVTLRRGARTVEVETSFDNTVEDHELRLLLPTDVPAETYLAHHPFDFVERPVALDPDTATWKEAEIPDKPFLHIQAIGAGRRGLAFIAEAGPHEGGVLDDARRTMLVTLMRSFRRTVGTSGERDGLEIGPHCYRYKLMPFAGDLPRVAACRELAALQGGVITRQTGRFSSGYPQMDGPAAPRRSLCALEDGRLVLSALKPQEAGGNLTLRLWNPTDQDLSERITFERQPQAACYTDLAERPCPHAQPPQLQGNTLTVTARPRQIVTVTVSF